MTLELPDIVIQTLIEALDDGILIQKQARLCDLAALDFLPTEILPHLKLHHQKAIARCSTTSKRILSNLTDYQNKPNVKVFPSYNSSLKIEKRDAESIAKDPNTPINILEQLANRNNSILLWLVKNPNIPTTLIKKIDRDYLHISSIQEYFAQNPATPMNILERLTTHKSSYIKKEAIKTIRSIHKEIAANPEASTEQLQEMVEHQDIRSKVNRYSTSSRIKFVTWSLFKTGKMFTRTNFFKSGFSWDTPSDI